MYVFVRKDLTPSQQAVQVAHAAIESTKNWPYILEHPHLVVLAVKGETQLRNALKRVRQETNVLCVEFIEDNDEMTAFATRPIMDHEERKFFRKYQLL